MKLADEQSKDEVCTHVIVKDCIDDKIQDFFIYFHCLIDFDVSVRSNMLMCERHDIEVLAMLGGNIETLRKASAETLPEAGTKAMAMPYAMLNTLC